MVIDTIKKITTGHLEDEACDRIKKAVIVMMNEVATGHILIGERGDYEEDELRMVLEFLEDFCDGLTVE